MVRALRIEYSGALYHITSRGNKQENIYLSDEDKILFLDIFSQVCMRCNWKCYAYCLMSNHYHLLELSRYIILNPVRARLVVSAADRVWSSYNSTIKQLTKPSWLARDYVLSLFGQNSLNSIKKYHQFVYEGMNVNAPWDELKNQIYLGSDNFVDEVQKKINLYTSVALYASQKSIK